MILTDTAKDAGYLETVVRRMGLEPTVVTVAGGPEWNGSLAGYDAILTLPTLGEAPPLETTGDPRLCTRWTLVGAPAISLPAGRGPAGLPLGLQLAAQPGADRRLLGAAAWVESRLA